MVVVHHLFIVTFFAIILCITACLQEREEETILRCCVSLVGVVRRMREIGKVSSTTFARFSFSFGKCRLTDDD